MTTHDPALCNLAVCNRCDAYGDGYAAGKVKAYEEVSNILGAPDLHDPDCGCAPCGLLRFLKHYVERDCAGIDGHIEGCGCGAGCGCWCHESEDDRD